MNKKILFFGLVALAVLLVGCTQQPTEGQTKTCSQLNGYACTENEQCFGQSLPASDSRNCCSVVCTQKSSQEASTKSCSEQSGYICQSKEKCEGSTLKASDTSSCCSIVCTPIETQNAKKTLEEMNWKKEDFSSDFVLNDIYSGYQKNALEYSDGNQERADQLLTNGWQENYATEYMKRSETQEIMGTKIVLEDYFASISRYDKTKGYAAYFEESLENYKKSFEEKGNSLLSQKFGDHSVFAKYTESNEYLGLTMIYYVLYFTKENYFANIYAKGQTRQITDEKVIELARKIESRIE